MKSFKELLGKTWFTVIYVVIALILLGLLQSRLSPTIKNIPYSTFKKYITDGKIQSVAVSTHFLRGYKQHQQGSKEPILVHEVYRTPRLDDPNLVRFLESNNVEIIAENENTFWMGLLSWLLPVLLIAGVWLYVMKRMGQGAGIMTLGKNKARIVAQTDVGVTFDDVAGPRHLNLTSSSHTGS